MTGKRRFGRVRQLPSGRWQARYAGPDGIDRPADETFATKTDADVWLTMATGSTRMTGRSVSSTIRKRGSRSGRAFARRRSSCTGTFSAGT